jgi:hypothetical protein
VASLAAASLLLAGCGGDDEKSGGDDSAAATATSTPSDTDTATGTTETSSAPEATDTTEATDPTVTTPTSPEDQPGGAGDEEPIGVEAEFTGNGGKVTPPVVQVPAFVGVTVKLRAADDATYTLTIGGKKLVAEGGKTATAKLDGLRQGAAYDGVLKGGGSVRIEATAEPGP